jgi:DNA polymerase II large subunit
MEEQPNITIPRKYQIYQENIGRVLEEQYALASKLKAQGIDPSTTIESPLALDLADRVAKLLEIPIADRLRSLLHEPNARTEQVALLLATEVASGKYPLPPGQTKAEAAVRIGLAIVTDGVTVAPIQGVSAVRTKENQNGEQYLSVEFAGPIRSAGGTESALTLVIANQVRKALGLEKYNANAFDDEPGRFIEELRIYERDVGNFQYKITDQDVRKAIENLPVEIDGVWTDNYEVTVHRDMRRISTNKVRGGALRVLNDGIVGKSKKMLKLLGELGIGDWTWLSDLSGGKQQGSDETKASSSHFDEVISGRPVLSMPGHSGGFRLRYGRAPNTGLHGVGLHPSVAVILNYPVVVGTQLKVDVPGKAASIAFVDTLESPLVRLKDGSVVKVRDVEHAQNIAMLLDSVLYLGDVLVSYGDFLENNVKLLPSAYVEEWWVLDFKQALERRYSTLRSAEVDLQISEARLRDLFSNPLRIFPTFPEVQRICKILNVPLHPRYLFYWDQATPEEILSFRSSIVLVNPDEIRVSKDLKPLLEKLGIEHTPICEEEYIITGEAVDVLKTCLDLQQGPAGPRRQQQQREVPIENWSDSPQLVSKLSSMIIKNKSSAWVGVRVGRPEKAMERKMRPPVQGLFPVGRSEGMSRDIFSASERSPTLSLELANIECPKCESRLASAKCPYCGVETRLFRTCTQCGRKSYENVSNCPACNGQMKSSSSTLFPLKQELYKAAQRVDYAPQKPLKGVLGLTNEEKIPERLEKVLLRQKYDLSVYRDGTIRYDATNISLTHFKPRQIQTTISKLKELGYTKDIYDNPLERDDQTLELFMQDIVIPYEAGAFLVSVSKFIDDLLIKHYSAAEPYFKIETPEGLLGHLVVGLAPHTSVGIIGRIVGYTNAQACFASPYWHSAKRRDCDGDGDSLILLMDVLLNFSKKFLPSIIGGLMDAPLLIQPLILPREVQRQAHHMDVCSLYPLQFYEATQRKENPALITKEMDIIKYRLGTPRQYAGFGFTHDTNTITVRQSRSSYSTLVSLQEKLDRQIELAQKIRAVNVDDVVKSVLRTHLLPDIIGNTKAFTSQKFRCKSCGAKYRRMPLQAVCMNCGGALQASITRGSVEKYLQLGLRLSAKFNVGDYLRSRFVIASEELATLFKPVGHQSDINDYFASTSEEGEPSVSSTSSLQSSASVMVEKGMANGEQILVAAASADSTSPSSSPSYSVLLNDEEESKESEHRSHKHPKQAGKKKTEQYQATLF